MQPKQLKKYLLPLAIASALPSTSLMAAVASYSVGFTTVPDITITEVQAMNFGNFLNLDASAACTMALPNTGAGYPGDAVMRLSRAVPVPATTPGLLTLCGSAGVAATGTVGIYEIQGIAGGTVKVSVAATTGSTDFDYTPDGCVVDYDNAGDGDACSVIDENSETTPIEVEIASAADTVGNSGTGNPTPGATRLALGGRIDATSVHTAGETLTESFTITVTY